MQRRQSHFEDVASTDLTAFERYALQAVAQTLGPEDRRAFEQQISAAKVVSRQNTIVGFYTEVEVDRERSLPATINKAGVAFEVEGVPSGMGVVLWDDNGFLKTIEGFTYGDEELPDVPLAELMALRSVS